MKRAVRAFALLIGGVTLMGLGCNSVLGIDEAEVDPSLAGGGTGGGGGGGTGGGGTGGGGTGGGGTGPVSCGDVIPDNDALVRACVLRASCYPFVPRFTISDCIALNTLGISNYEFCMQDARTCEDVEGCTGYAYVADTTVCNGVTSQWVCDGDVAVRCGTTRPYRVDCGRLGATCLPYDETAVPETTWPCHVAGINCSGVAAGTWNCAGDVAYQCIQGTPYGTSCTTQQMVCNDDLPGSAYCSDLTATCTERGVVRCEDESITICDTTGYFARYDCAVAGGTCDTDGTSTGYCIAPGCAKDTECDEECVDPVNMKLCIGGAPFRVDCTDYGFTECGDYTDQETGSPYVLCK